MMLKDLQLFSVHVVLVVLVPVFTDKEFAGHVHTKHDINGQHNVEFDHEAILGSQDLNDEYSKLSAHEARQRLVSLLVKMDTNRDAYISSSEIADWVLNNFRKQDVAESAQKLAEADADGDGVVTWAEYVQKVFGYTLEELEEFARSTDPAIVTFNRMVDDEMGKFKLADRDDNGKLDLDEYSAFLHPHSFEHMHNHEINRALMDYDRNNDGMISFAEYIGESKPGQEQLIVDKENFNSYDTNGDGQLDRNELKAWVLPDRRTVAEEEAEHLMSETDRDRDGQLSFAEIADRHDLWVGSAATDYGQNLKHDPSEL